MYFQAVEAYQMTVKNGIICGGAVAPNYFCPVPSITETDEQELGTTTNLVLRSSCGQMIASNGAFYCQDNFVMDRDDSMIAMPIPIVKVSSELSLNHGWAEIATTETFVSQTFLIF